MTTKEHLEQVWKMETRVAAKREQLEQMERIGQILSRVEDAESEEGDLREDVLAKVRDLKEEILKEVASMLKCREEIVQAIHRLPAKEQRLVMEMRYLSGMRWERIAEELQYSLRGVYKIHKKALSQIKFPLE